MTRKEKSIELFRSGYNCSQAVIGAFSDDIKNIKEQDLLSLTAGFGGGFARTRGQCGAVSAMAMVIGLIKAESSGDVNKTNGDVYAYTRKAIDDFVSINDTIQCDLLLKNLKNIEKGGSPQKRDETYYKDRPCTVFVTQAVEIVEKICFE